VCVCFFFLLPKLRVEMKDIKLKPNECDVSINIIYTMLINGNARNMLVNHKFNKILCSI